MDKKTVGGRACGKKVVKCLECGIRGSTYDKGLEYVWSSLDRIAYKRNATGRSEARDYGHGSRLPSYV